MTGGVPKRGAMVVLRHSLESMLYSLNLNSSLATMNLQHSHHTDLNHFAIHTDEHKHIQPRDTYPTSTIHRNGNRHEQVLRILHIHTYINYIHTCIPVLHVLLGSGVPKHGCRFREEVEPVRGVRIAVRGDRLRSHCETQESIALPTKLMYTHILDSAYIHTYMHRFTNLFRRQWSRRSSRIPRNACETRHTRAKVISIPFLSNGMPWHGMAAPTSISDP